METTEMAFTSVPAWARDRVDALGAVPPVSGARHLLVGVGPTSAETLRGWEQQLVGTPIHTVHTIHTIHTVHLDEADTALSDALADARVGVRIHLAGPIGDCLRLRATALRAGAEDDEIQVSPTTEGTIWVQCLHCEAVTAAEARINDIIECAGCGLGLVVYYHVSRRTGHFMGFQIDAETAEAMP